MPTLKSNKDRVLFGIVALAIAGIAVWGVTALQRPAASGPKTLLLEIQNSGSTNTKAWDLNIYTDGSGTSDNDNFAPGTFDTTALTQALDGTNLSSLPSGGCVRSASFGSVDTLTYKNQTMNDAGCYIQNQPDAPLSRSLNAALARAHHSL